MWAGPGAEQTRTIGAGLIDGLLSALRIEMVDRALHGAALGDLQAHGGGASMVDRTTIAFAARHGIRRALAFDADLEVAGLEPVTKR